MVSNTDEVLERHLEQDAELRIEWERDHKLRRDPRVTPVGYFLRKCSLDESPQVWNVLPWRHEPSGTPPDRFRGDPQVQSRIRRFSPRSSGAYRPLAGFSRNDTTYQERVELDCYYVQNWSPWLDLNIISRP
jgi:lipopolysaccharide/colanic/teichoic acid biosynthesis glycosyltransferase